jgi:UDP-glucose 4-epimerase
MILLTGGGGLYGVNIAWYLANRGKEVLLLQRSPFQAPSFLAPYWDKQVKGVRGDVQDLPFLMGLVKDYHVESLIHLAGTWPGGGREVPVHQALQVNIGGTINVLEAARIFGLRRVTFASSNSLYHGMRTPPNGPYHEDLDLSASRHIGYIPCMKRAGEQICLLYAEQYNMSVCLIRGGRGYGPNKPSASMPLQRMVLNALEGKPTDMTGMPENRTEAPVYVKDLARGYGLLHLADSLKHPIYNISSGNSYSLLEFARTVREIIPGAEIRLGPASPDEEAFCPDITRAKEDVGYIPEYAGVKEGIQAWIDFLRDGKY